MGIQIGQSNLLKFIIGSVLVLAAILVDGERASTGGGLFLAPLVTTPASVIGGVLIGYATASVLSIGDSNKQMGFALIGGLIAATGPVAAFATVTNTGFLPLLSNTLPIIAGVTIVVVILMEIIETSYQHLRP